MNIKWDGIPVRECNDHRPLIQLDANVVLAQIDGSGLDRTVVQWHNIQFVLGSVASQHTQLCRIGVVFLTSMILKEIGPLSRRS